MICTSVVAAQLGFGAAESDSRELAKSIDQLFNAIDVLPRKEPADQVYGLLRQSLASRGRLTGSNDLLIAAHTLASELTLATANVKAFSRVLAIRVENWLAN